MDGRSTSTCQGAGGCMGDVRQVVGYHHLLWGIITVKGGWRVHRGCEMGHGSLTTCSGL